MQLIRSIKEMQSCAESLRKAGKRIGFVPTMGCLHEGHLKLIDCARQHCDTVVVSIFVNPTQFGPTEDFSRYPRMLETDAELCRTRGTAIVFAPNADEFYPKDFSTYVNEELCSQGLCGEFRPGHFRGVTTVVHMLFNLVHPDVAIFGQKDAQQVAVLKKMVADLFLPVTLIVAPIIREDDGLAMSSRNRYLSPEHRATAPQLYIALTQAKALVEKGETDAKKIIGAVEQHLTRHPDFRIQYIKAVDATTMQPVETITPSNTLLALAAHIGATRLIDNILL